MLTTILVGLILLAFGIAFCFYGFRAFLVLLPIIGFIVGFYIGAQAMQIALAEGFLASTLSIIVGLLSGVIGAFAAYVFFMIGIIMVAGTMGFALAAGILDLLGIDPGCIAFLVALGTAGLAVWLTMRYKLVRYILIVFTAILGANAIVLSILLIFNRVSLQEVVSPTGTFTPILAESPFYIIAFLVLLGVGIYVQFVASRDFDFENIKLLGRWTPTRR